MPCAIGLEVWNLIRFNQNTIENIKCVNPASLAQLLHSSSNGKSWWDFHCFSGYTCRWHLGGQERGRVIWVTQAHLCIFVWCIVLHPQSLLIHLCLCDQFCLPLCSLGFQAWVLMLVRSWFTGQYKSCPVICTWDLGIIILCVSLIPDTHELELFSLISESGCLFLTVAGKNLAEKLAVGVIPSWCFPWELCMWLLSHLP